MDKIDIENLEFQTNALIKAFERLKAENISLRENNARLLAQKAELLDKHKQATVKIDNLITNLKTVEIA